MALPAGWLNSGGWHEVGSCAWRRDDDTFTFVWANANARLVLDHIRESGAGDIQTEITVTDADGSHHVHWARLNLLSTTARESLANTLTKRQKASGATGPELTPWPLLIERACMTTGKQWRMGSPFLDLADHRPGARPRDLLTRFLPYGQPAILYARGGSGKSFVATGICASVITGRALATGIEPTETGPVLYLDWEGDEDEQHGRIVATLRGMGVEQIPRGMFLYRRQHRPLVEDAGRIGEEIARAGIKLVVVDSLVAAMAGSAIEEGTAREMLNAMRSWKATPLMIAHVNKADATSDGKGAKTIYGNMFFEYLARITWEVRKSESIADGDGMAVGLYNRKVNRAPKSFFGLRLRFDGDPDFPDVIRFHGWSVADDESLSGTLPLGARIIDAVRRFGPMDNDQLAERLSGDETIKPDTIGRTARRLSVLVNTQAEQGGRSVKAIWGLLDRVHQQG
jgi:hypothetical protein